MTGHPRQKPYRQKEVSALLRITPHGLRYLERADKLRRNQDGTYSVAEVTRLKRERIAALREQLAALEAS